jgi:hypothetical protein
VRALGLGLLLLVACQAGPHGPDQLEIVAVDHTAEGALPEAFRVQAFVELGEAPAPGWDVRLPLPSDGVCQRVHSLMIQVGGRAEQRPPAGDERLLHVTGAGPLTVSWRGWVERALDDELSGLELPQAMGEVDSSRRAEAWAHALAAAGVEARVVHGLDVSSGAPVTCRWVEVRVETGWVPVDSATRRAGLPAGRIRLGAAAPTAQRGGEAVDLTVRYELLPPS